MPNFAFEPHPGFKSVNKAQNWPICPKSDKQLHTTIKRRRAFFESILRHPDSEHVDAAYQFWSSFLSLTRCDNWWKEDVDLLPCFWEKCCATKIDRYQDKPLWAHPPPHLLHFLFCAGCDSHSLKNFTSKKPTYDGQKKHFIPTVERRPPASHRCDLDANGAASPSPASALGFAATPPRVCFGSAAQKAQPLGRNWGTNDDGGAGKKWFRMPGIFPYKNEEPLQWMRSDDNLFLSWFQVSWLNCFSLNVSLPTRFQLIVVI